MHHQIVSISSKDRVPLPTTPTTVSNADKIKIYAVGGDVFSHYRVLISLNLAITLCLGGPQNDLFSI